jgi:hypothetical protein
MANPGPATTVTPQYVEAVASARNPIAWGMLAQSSAAIVAPADTTEDVLVTVNLDPGYLGANSRVKVRFNITNTNNANVKTFRVRLGGLTGTAMASFATTSLAGVFGEVEMVMNASQQAETAWGVVFNAAPAVLFSANATAVIDVSLAQTLVLTSQKATGGDTFTLVSYSVEHFYGQ